MKYKELLDSNCYDLSHPLDRQTPVLPAHPPFFMTLNNRHGDINGFFGECGYGSANEIIVTSGHHSTHIDALGHVSDYGKLFGGIEATDVQKGLGLQRGLTKNGVENINPIIKRGILLDIPLLKGKTCLDAAERITEADLKEALSKQKISIEPGDCVLIRTGYSKFLADPDIYMGIKTGLPGPDISAAVWLATKKVFLAGSDTIPFEVRIPGIKELPVHQELIAKNGIHIIECLNLEELAQDKHYEFLFIALPLRITGATGSPIRPIALV